MKKVLKKLVFIPAIFIVMIFVHIVAWYAYYATSNEMKTEIAISFNALSHFGQLWDWP